MRLLLVGRGRMGRIVEQLAPQYGFELAGVLEEDSNAGGAGVTAERCRGVDVAVDFSTPLVECAPWSYNCYFPMPFKSRARVLLQPPSAKFADPDAGTVTVRLLNTT